MGETNSDTTSIKLVIPSRLQLVDLVHSTSEQVAGLAGFDSGEALNVGIAVREAVINAIVHGNKQDPERDVDLLLEIAEGTLRATVRDQGEGFDPDATPDPTEQENLLATSGRGLLMIRAFVDEVEFACNENGSGMQLTLVKRRPEDNE
jgi:serine/threonine-protein kinase RsbW